MKSLRILVIAVAFALAGCEERTHWSVRHVPTTEAERNAVAEQVAKIMAATPRSLAGNDQDWDDAIAAATESAKSTLCRPTLWESRGYGQWTGNWRYVDQPQPEKAQ